MVIYVLRGKGKLTLIGCLTVSRSVSLEVSRTKDGFPNLASTKLTNERVVKERLARNLSPHSSRKSSRLFERAAYFPRRPVLVLAV